MKIENALSMTRRFAPRREYDIYDRNLFALVALNATASLLSSPRNSNTLTPNFMRLATLVVALWEMLSSSPLPRRWERRSSATSFDALSRQRRSDGGYLGTSDEMMQPVNVVVRKKSGFTAVQQQQQQLQEMQLKLLKQQQAMERQKFQMEHQQQNLRESLKRESVRPHSAQAAGRGGTKRRMSGPPIIFHNPPSVDGGSVASDR